MHDFLALRGNEVDVSGAPETISILPLGHVVSSKGEFEVDEESFEAMKAQIAQRGVDLVVDYEHQTLGGGQAPAAGWVKELILDGGKIKARVEWTPKAREYLENKEYRYLSPVITVRKSDNKAMGMHSVALTNTPAIENMEPIVNSTNYKGGNNTMELVKMLAELLGLGEDATEQQVVEALKSCIQENKSLKEKAGAGTPPPAEEDKVVANKQVCELLGLKAGAATADVTAAIMALKGGIVGDVNLKQKVQDLERTISNFYADEAARMALKAGKITPAQEEWAKSYALKDLNDFKAFVEKAPQVVPMGEIGGSDETLALKSQKPDEATMLVCKQLGISAEDVAKYGMKED